MFNIYSSPGSTIDFQSNPPLPDEFVVEGLADPETGVMRNVIDVVPKSNAPLFDGVHFDEATDGLRAKLNLGIRMYEVPPINIQRDPIEYANISKKFVDSAISIYDRLSQTEEVKLVEPTAVPE